jgi:DNA-directed RNA polymerase specialized sigma24 family protein
MTRNKVVDHYRNEARQNKAAVAAISGLQTEISSAEETALENLEREETVRMVRSHLQKLQPEEQELLLEASSGKPLTELAEQLQITYGVTCQTAPHTPKTKRFH